MRSGPVDPMEPGLHVTINLASRQRFGHGVTGFLLPIDVEEANDWFSIVGRRDALTNSVESKKVVTLGQTVSGNGGAHDNRFVVSRLPMGTPCARSLNLSAKAMSTA